MARSPFPLVVALCAALIASSPRPALAGDLPASSDLIIPGLTGTFAGGSLADRLNPAGLSFLEGQQLSVALLHTGINTPSDTWSTGVHWAWSQNGFASGLSLQWFRGAGIADSRTATWSLAVGNRAIAFGAAARWYHAHDPALDKSVTFDLGLAGRPWRYFGWSISARNFGSVNVVPTFRAGLGVHLWDGRITAGVDRVWTPVEDPFSAGGRLEWGLRLRLVDGLTLTGTVAEPVGTNDSLRVLAGLRFDLTHFGISGAMPVDHTPGGDGAIVFQISTARHRALVEKPGLVVIDVDDALEPDSRFHLLPRPPRIPLIDLVREIDQARRDPHVDGVLLRCGGTKLSMPEAEELRHDLASLKAVGKQVVFYLDGASDATYYLASIGTRIYVAPGATLLINGLAASTTFFGKGLSDLGVHAEFVRVGRYKNAPDELTRSDMSDAQREVTSSLLDDTYARYVKTVAADRKIDAKKLESILSNGILGAEQAKKLGLVDDVAYPDELPARIGGSKGPALLIRGYAHRTYADRPWSEPPVVAVIPVVGAIVSGDTPKGPFTLVKATGSSTVIRAVERAERDPSVAAIVVYIDSPGGDAHASDLIWRALRKANERKPVIADMGDVAASGGYYVAAGARWIVAEPSTITGSIGIFAGHVDLTGLYKHLGVNVVGTLRGKNADILGTNHKWTDAERAAMQRFVDQGYHLFTSRVAKTRPLTEKQVDAIGRGHVWTGAQAQKRKLVDALGTFGDAVAKAKSAAGLRADEVVSVAVFAPHSGPLAAFTGRGRPLAEDELPPAVSLLVHQLGPLVWTLGDDRPLALLPYRIAVQ